MKRLLIILSAVITILNLPNAALAVAPNFIFSTDTVYDSANNLTWTRVANTPGPAACSPGVAKDWYAATGTYINCLNSNNYLGYNDWRVPTIYELRIFRDNALHYNDLNTLGFANVQSSYYWSGTTYFIGTGTVGAWDVSMNAGIMNGYSKTGNSFFVWPVRGDSLALSVTKTGTGSGTVTSSTGGISCGSTCSASVASGTSVTLTAAPASGSTFDGWSGACTGTATTCNVSMTAAQSVGAAFNLAPIVTNGSCGLSNGTTATVAPSSDLCTSGSASTVSGTGPWSWSCGGSNGGTTANCSATLAASSQTGTIPVTGVVRLRPQVIMGGFDPILIDLGETSFNLFAVVRPGAAPIQQVQTAGNGGGFSMAMNYAGTYANGDQRYERAFTFPRGAFPDNTLLGDLFGSAGSQFRMSVVDTAQQTHNFPDLEFGNQPAMTQAVTSPDTVTSSAAGIRRSYPQVLAAGFDPQLIDLVDDAFNVVAIVRQGLASIYRVSLSQNQGAFAIAMNQDETLPNGDVRYKATYTYQRGAFPAMRASDLFGTQPGQFNIMITDQAQFSHSFPGLRWGNWPVQK